MKEPLPKCRGEVKSAAKRFKLGGQNTGPKWLLRRRRNPDAVTSFATSFGVLHRVAKGSNGGTFIRFPRKSIA